MSANNADWLNDYESERPIEALIGSLREYRLPQGSDLLKRVEPFFRWQDLRRAHELWPYSKSTECAPRSTCSAKTDRGDDIAGVNFASQDYLSLASDSRIKEAAKNAIDEFGVHSAGSAALLGNTKISLELERAIAEFVGRDHVTLYPTGWSAGFAAVQGLVRDDDHVLMDVLAHSCMQEGARAATRNIQLYGHLNVEGARRKLRRIRAKDTKNGILVITESLFSMHSDTPDLAKLLEVCREYDATLLVDVAHDLGCIGDDGLGHLGLQKMVDKVDIIVGSFSKTFASNGGFVVSGQRSVKEYLKYFSATQTFSNALSPAQAAVALRALEIIRSDEGAMLRKALMSNVLQLRAKLKDYQFEVLGDPSAIVPVNVGAEGHARIAAKRLHELGAIANLVEYPAVPKGGARFRLQVMAKHSAGEIDALVTKMRQAVDEAEVEFRPYRHIPLSAAAESMDVDVAAE